jgi:hypothetical protein
MIDGYVVNIYDVLNYDIDIKTSISNLITNPYTYKDIVNVITGELGIEKKSTTVRCRLVGIGINQKNKKQKNEMTYEVKKLINHVDGWVKCTIVGVDVYNRLLLDIYLPILNLHLNDYILQHDCHQLFYIYSHGYKNKATNLK